MAFIVEYTKYLSSFHTAIYAQKDEDDDEGEFDDEEEAEDDEILLI